MHLSVALHLNRQPNRTYNFLNLHINLSWIIMVSLSTSSLHLTFHNIFACTWFKWSSSKSHCNKLSSIIHLVTEVSDELVQTQQCSQERSGGRIQDKRVGYCYYSWHSTNKLGSSVYSRICRWVKSSTALLVKHCSSIQTIHHSDRINYQLRGISYYYHPL
jgi:hypothetical protein